MNNTKVNLPKREKTKNVWKRYREIVHSLYLDNEKSQKIRQRDRKRKFLLKNLVVFLAGFLTTLSFALLTKPNGIYNGGLNGLLQVIFNSLAGRFEAIRLYNNYFLFGTALLINLSIIAVLWRFFSGKLNTLSTALTYSLAQLFWNWVIDKLKISGYLFNSFVVKDWTKPEKKALALPFYLVLALLAAVIHTYGYSLIFKVQGTPGGLEIFTSHFSQVKKKGKVALTFLFKLFGLLIIFLITLFSYIWIKDNHRVKKAELKTYLWEKNQATESKFIRPGQTLEQVIQGWKTNQQQQKALAKKNQELEENLQWENSLQERNKKKQNMEKNQQSIWDLQEKSLQLTYYLKQKVKSYYWKDHPEEELEIYLAKKNKLRELLAKKIQQKEKEILTTKGKARKKLKNYIAYLTELKKNQQLKTWKAYLEDYLKYITNNEKLWASLVYIFFSSFLISKMFPKDVEVILRVQTNYRHKLEKILSLLKEFRPVFYVSRFYHFEKAEEESAYLTSCSLTKWEYYLLKQDLEALKVKFFISKVES